MVSTPSEIAKYTGLTSGATTTMLDRLERRGFVKRKRSKRDRRSVTVMIQKKYALKAQKLVLPVQKAHTQLIADFSDSELQIISRFLEGFTRNLVEQIQLLEK